MRGRIIPAGFLVAAMAAAIWLSLSRPNEQWAEGWQMAGVGELSEKTQGDAATGKKLIKLVGSFVGGGPAEAQGSGWEGRAGTSAGGTVRPRFSRITISPGRESNFSGSGPPEGEVSVKLDGKVLGITRIDANGRWQMTAPALGAGDHRVQLSLEPAGDGGGVRTEGQDVRIAIPEGGSGSQIVAFEDADNGEVKAEPASEAASQSRVRDHAERLAREASGEFDDFTDRQLAKREERRRVAQDDKTASGEEEGRGSRDGSSSIDPLKPVEDWFLQSSRDYFGYVVPELAKKGPREPSVIAKNVPPPERPGDVSRERPNAPALPDLGGLASGVLDWLREANRTYQEEVVVDLSRKPEAKVARQNETPGEERDVASQPTLRTEERTLSRKERLDEMATEAARRAVEDRRAAEARRLEEKRAAESRRRADAEDDRLADLERERRLNELLARREAQTRSAAVEAQAETEREKALKREEERRTAERAREEEQRQALQRAREAERKQQEARELERLLAEQDAARKRAELEKKQRQAALQAERERQLRLETERVAREAVERERLAAEEQAREETERRLRIAREEEAGVDRRNARVVAKSERADVIAGLADEAGFGKKQVRSGLGRSIERRQDVVLPERNREADRGFAVSDRGERDGMSRLEREEDQIVADGRPGWGERDGDAAPSDTDARRRPGSLKDHLEMSVDDAAGARLAGWRMWTEPIATGCKDHRAGRSIQVPGTYVVARGDTLWQISWRHYRNGELFRRIYKANRRKIRNARRIYPCQRLWLPRL